MADSIDFTGVGHAFGRLSQEFAALSTSMQRGSKPEASQSSAVGVPEVVTAVSALQSANEALVNLQRSQLGHEKMFEQRLTTLQGVVERLERNLPKQIAVEYAQLNARMHNVANSIDVENPPRLLPLPDDRGSVPIDFPLYAQDWASPTALDEAAVLKLLVFYGLSTEGDHHQRRVNLGNYCGVRLHQK